MATDEKKIALYKKINGFTGPLSRTRWHWRTKAIARLLATYSVLINNGERKDSVEAIAEEWRRIFGLNQFWKIDRVENDTAYCEIHFKCSLEKTGDIQACYRLMEYDRAMLEKIGGQMVVLESRADPKVTGSCKVAIRKLEDRRADLIPAHLIE